MRAPPSHSPGPFEIVIMTICATIGGGVTCPCHGACLELVPPLDVNI